MFRPYDEEDDGIEDEEEYEGEEDELLGVSPVPANFKKLTDAQHALAELLRVPEELLAAAARHSSTAASAPKMDIAAAVGQLPQDRRSNYLVRLANNEPGLSRLLLTELRELSGGPKSAAPTEGERVPFAQLVTESEAVKAQLAREKREQEEAARRSHLKNIHEHQETFWRQVDKSVARGTSAGYDDATKVLIDLRAAASQFKETPAFQQRFSTWIRTITRRPAFIKRLQNNQFPIPGA